jgi:hypothetical protein
MMAESLPSTTAVMKGMPEFSMRIRVQSLLATSWTKAMSACESHMLPKRANARSRSLSEKPASQPPEMFQVATFSALGCAMVGAGTNNTRAGITQQ